MLQRFLKSTRHSLRAQLLFRKSKNVEGVLHQNQNNLHQPLDLELNIRQSQPILETEFEKLKNEIGLEWDDESDFEKFGRESGESWVKVRYPERVEHKQLVPYVFCTKEQMENVEVLREILDIKINNKGIPFDFVIEQLKRNKKKGSQQEVSHDFFTRNDIRFLIYFLVLEISRII